MKTLFNNLVRFGLEEDTPDFRKDEIKLMNSISIHSIVFTVCSAIAGAVLLPKHIYFILVVSMTEVIAKACVLLLHFVQRFTPAKIIFTMITLFVFLMMMVYFGINSNFQFLIVTTCFTLVIIFKNGTAEDIFVMGMYLLVGVGGTTIIYWQDAPMIKLSAEELEVGRVIAYSMNLTLAIMVSVIFFTASRSEHSLSKRNLTEVSKIATILNTISENMNDGIFKAQPEKGFVYVNHAFAEIFGYDSIDDIIHESAVRLYQSSTERDELIDEVRARGAVNNRLILYRKKNGESFWGRLSVKLIMEGGEEMLVGTVTDVSIQQEHEQLLKESESQLREAQKIAKIGNWQLFNASKILRWSDECMHIHGFNSLQTDHDYRDWLERLDDVDESRVDTLMAKAMMTKEEVEFSSWYTTPDDERKYLVYITRYQRSDKVKGGVWYGTVQDFTEQKLAEIRLTELKQFYESWIDQLPIEAVMIDERKRYLYVSKNAIKDEKLRNWMIGKTNADYVKYRGISEDIVTIRDRMIDKALETNKLVKWEEKMKTRGGEDSYHLRMLFPTEVVENRKQKRVLIGYSFDLNEIKKAQFELESKNKELSRLNQELDRFVYSISHDLRAPIASVISLVTLAKDTQVHIDLDELFAMQQESLERLDQYIKDVLDYSRNKRTETEHIPINLGDVVNSSIDELLRLSKDESACNFHLDMQATELNSDPMRIKIVIHNLISNAIKFRDHNKDVCHISVRSRKNEKSLILEVEDNGIGIQPKYINKIWDMFFRGTSDHLGSGLGLYILRESAKAIGAEVEVKSTYGQGSMFTVSFPLTTKEFSSNRPSIDSSL